MTIGAFSGEISYTVTSSTFERQPGGTRVVINLEGEVSDYGPVNGTMTLTSGSQGAAAGPVSFTGAAFPPSGDVVGGLGEGFWQKVDGNQRWRIRGVNLISNGAVLLTDAILDLATRTYKGTLAEWS